MIQCVSRAYTFLDFLPFSLPLKYKPQALIQYKKKIFQIKIEKEINEYLVEMVLDLAVDLNGCTVRGSHVLICFLFKHVQDYILLNQFLFRDSKFLWLFYC